MATIKPRSSTPTKMRSGKTGGGAPKGKRTSTPVRQTPFWQGLPQQKRKTLVRRSRKSGTPLRKIVHKVRGKRGKATAKKVAAPTYRPYTLPVYPPLRVRSF